MDIDRDEFALQKVLTDAMTVAKVSLRVVSQIAVRFEFEILIEVGPLNTLFSKFSVDALLVPFARSTESTIITSKPKRVRGTVDDTNRTALATAMLLRDRSVDRVMVNVASSRLLDRKWMGAMSTVGKGPTVVGVNSNVDESTAILDLISEDAKK
jgi:hypothetical protein